MITAAQYLKNDLEPYLQDDDTGDLSLWLEMLALPFEWAFRYVMPQDGLPAWGPIFDPNASPLVALPYLAQFPGAELTPGGDEARWRSDIKHVNGWKRGNPDSLAADVAAVLTGTQRVVVDERFGNSAWQLLVATYQQETPSQTAVQAVLAKHKIVGTIITYQLRDHITYGDVKTRNATYAQVKTTYPSYGAMTVVPV